MFSFEATFYDGMTSEPHAVKVHVEYGGSARLVGEGVAQKVERREMRFAPRLGDTLRSIFLPDGQKLETLDNDAVDALARLEGSGAGAAWVDRLEGSWPLVIAALAVILVVVGAGAVWGIPYGAKRVAALVPAELVQLVGRDTLAVLDRTMFERSEADQQERSRAEEAFARVAALHPELPLRLELRAMAMPNAFALPDGTVVVADELIALAEDDDELAAVIAHEIGHVHHRHGLRMVLESSSVALLISIYLGDVGQISAVLAGLPAVYSQAGYSRAHEVEADEFALELMDRAGIEAGHFANILQKLSEDAEAETTGALQYLSSHPRTDERISRIEQR